MMDSSALTFLQIFQLILMKFGVLLQPFGLCKLISRLFHTINVEERQLHFLSFYGENVLIVL